MSTTDTDEAVWLEGRWRRHRSRSVEWAAVPETLAAVVAAWAGRAEVVNVVGPVPGGAGGPAAFAYGAPLPEGWTDGGHLLDGGRPIFRAVGPFVDGRRLRLEVHRAETWVGEDTGAAPAELARAHRLLAARVRGAFGQSAGLLSTPATTGRDLILRSLPPGRWGVLPAAEQDEIRATAGQGRIEGCWSWPDWPGPAGGTDGVMPGLTMLDMRFAYGALCRELPAWVEGGPGPTRDSRPEYAGFRRGRYRVTWAAPAGWAHVGILPASDCPDAIAPAAPAGRRWTWPLAGTGWVDGAELGIALRAGWAVTIHERWLWPDRTGRGPLDGWQDRLVRLWAGAESDLERAMLRSIMLHAIGALWGRRSRVTRAAAWPCSLPPGAREVRVAGDRVTWSEDRPPAWPELVHPEWAAAIWARCRGRLLAGPGGTGVLGVPWSTVVALATDAVYFTGEPPAWLDKGRPGNWREKGRRVGVVPVPRNRAELLAVRP